MSAGFLWAHIPLIDDERFRLGVEQVLVVWRGNPFRPWGPKGKTTGVRREIAAKWRARGCGCGQLTHKLCGYGCGTGAATACAVVNGPGPLFQARSAVFDQEFTIFL